MIETAMPIGDNEVILRVTVQAEASRTWLFEPYVKKNCSRRFCNDFRAHLSDRTFGRSQLCGPTLSLEPDSDTRLRRLASGVPLCSSQREFADAFAQGGVVDSRGRC